MKIKHIKLLSVASYINLFLGIFLIICGIIEITGILKTDANTSIEAGGVQLSYLVFISGILVFISGLFTLLNKKTMDKTNLQIIIGAVSLAWPIFVSIALFFAQLIICIRLVPTAMSSLFYMISLLIVKITNESLRKVHKFNPSAHVETMGKRKAGVNIANTLGSSGKRAKTVHRHNLSGGLGKLFKPVKRSKGSSRLYSGSRKRGGIRLKRYR